MMTEPPAPVPVPCDPAILKLAPAIFDVPVTTDCVRSVCATGDAASAAPSWKLAALGDVNGVLLLRVYLAAKTFNQRLVPPPKLTPLSVFGTTLFVPEPII